ncbi:glycosyltransferase family 4 protein, partial [Acidobacteria bacterium ACD]|nr:glycosyltransferase family 4 protein [Acidobacteria bacterium ACD]
MRKRPRVAVAAPGCGSGGSVGWVAAWHARELGREFETALFSDSPPSGRGPYDFVPVDTPQFRPLRRLSHVPREVAFAAGVGRALLRHYAPGEPMAVVCHGHVLTAVAGRALNRRLGVAVLMVTHGDVFERPRGTYDATLTALYKYASAVAYQDADAVIALSTAMAELAVRGGARPGRVFVVPNGVEPEALGPAWDEPRPRPAATTRLQLLFVGRLAVEKGVEDLIEAVCILEEEGHGVQLQIVGDGPEAAALRKGIRDRFRHLVT